MNWTDLKPIIKEKLETLSGNGQKIGQVIGKQTGDIETFPAVTITRGSLFSEPIANSDNKDTYAFTLFIHQEAATIDEEDAEDIVAGVADDIKAAFDTDFNLGGAVDFCKPINTQNWGTYTGEHGVVVYCPMVIECTIETQVLYGP